MTSYQEAYTYQTAEDGASGSHTSSGFSKLIANFRFAGKMMVLLMLVIICTIFGNLWSAYSARDVIRDEIVHGMVNQVHGLHAQLSAVLRSDPIKFMTIARQTLTDTRWEQDKSGYAFLIDRQGKLVIYPPSSNREGGMLDPVQVEGRDENVNQAFTRIGQGDAPESIIYPYVKPGTTERILKVAHVYPLGDYMLVSGVYIDRADQAFADYLKQSAVLIAIMLLLIGGVITLFSKAIGQQVQSSLQALNRITQRNVT